MSELTPVPAGGPQLVAEQAHHPMAYEIPDGTKVLVATPNYTNLFSSEVHVNHVECASSWKDWGLDYNWMIIGRTFVHFARSQACRAAVDGGFTHIFWLDDDAVIDPEILPRFLSHDKDVVISPYPMRRSPFQVGILSSRSYYCRDCEHRTAWVMDEAAPEEMECEKCKEMLPRDFHEHISYRNFTAGDLDKGLVDVDGGGTHAMLVKTSVLTGARGFPPPTALSADNKENRSYPDRAYSVYLKLTEITQSSDRELVDHYIGDLPDQSQTLAEEDAKDKPFFSMPKVGTEDMLWCYRAKCKGVQIFCDTDVFAQHVGFAPVVDKNFVLQMEALREVDNPEEVIFAAPGGHSRDWGLMDTAKQASLT